jgi:hypothetical protein
MEMKDFFQSQMKKGWVGANIGDEKYNKAG